MESAAPESRARVPLALGVLVARPFVGGSPADPAQPDKKAVNTSDNGLTDAMTATARIYWGARDMHAVTAERLQNAVNGVPAPNDSPGSHGRPVTIVSAPDPSPDAFATYTKCHKAAEAENN